MQEQKTAIYIGAGLDVRPIRAMKDIDRFVYVDSRPATQQPEYDRLYRQFDRTFVNDFCRKMEAMDFEWNMNNVVVSNLNLKIPEVIEFEKDKKKVVYYMNTHFAHDKFMCPSLLTDLGNSDTLIVAGFHPDANILDLMKKPVHIICWEGTNYEIDSDDCNSVIKRVNSDVNKSEIASIQFYKKEYTMTFLEE